MSEQEILKWQADVCMQCGYCRATCPVYQELPWESASPRGKIYYMKEYYESKIKKGSFGKGKDKKIDEDFAKMLYWCTSCGACEVNCHVEMPLPEMWEDLKAWAVENGLGPLAAHKVFLERIHEKKNPFNEEPATRGDWAKEFKLSPRPDVLFFGGCTESYRMQILAQASIKVLQKAGVKVGVLGGEEWCCTSPLLRTGQRSETKPFAKHLREQIIKSGAKTVISACSGCYATLKNDHSKVMGKHPFELYHLSEYIEMLIKKGKLKFKTKINRKVTYHDPCHLGRHGKVFEAPRNVIKSIPGIELIEMPNNRKNSACCGAGAGFKAQFNENAENIAAKRIREAQGTGADEMITTCPFCNVNLNGGAKKAGVEMKTKDLVQLILEALEANEEAEKAAKEVDKEIKPAVC